MFTQPQTVILFLLITAGFYWLVPASMPGFRRALVIAVSCLLIAYESVAALGVMVALTLWTILGGQLIARGGAAGSGLSVWIKRAAFWGTMAGLAAPLAYFDLRAEPIAFLGVSYVVIKSAGVLIDANMSSRAPQIGEVFVLNAFFPIYSAGPIEERQTFEKSAFARAPQLAMFRFGVYRLLEGYILSFYLGQSVLAGVLLQYTDQAYINPDITGLAVVAVILLKFLFLYVNFAGYSSMAIGLAAFFGIRIRENFRLPFLARNPEEFWARWHLSLGDFLRKYLYFRMVVAFKRPYLALFAAFVIVGLWHQIGLPYLLWGIGHGGALVGFLLLKRRFAAQFKALPAPARTVVGLGGWALTMLWVSLLSYVANAPDLATAGQILTRITP